MTHFLAIVGTNSTTSTNRQLLEYMQRHYADQATIDIVEIDQLPLFNKPDDLVIPPAATAIATQIEAADGVIIGTPEYDHAVPAVLMNALEWLSYHIHPFQDKPVMITGSAYGNLGTSRAQAHLRVMLDSPEIRAMVMPSSEFLLDHSLQAFDENGDLLDPAKADLLDGLFTDFQTFVAITKQLTHGPSGSGLPATAYSWKHHTKEEVAS